ncbi:MAG: DNA sulfur modification protein DndB [Candidatus Cybelea sp.]
MSPSELTKWIRARYGDVIDFGPVVAGKNLNLFSIRGFARLDRLAIISAPDVFDMVRNPTGTQRDLKPKHAKECFDYAADSLELDPLDEPRAFPEVILNARDGDVVEIYDLNNPEDIYDISSFEPIGELEFGVAGLRVNLKNLVFPKPDKTPKISRVDGNHRLHGADEEIEKQSLMADELPNGDDLNGELEFPDVPFCMLLGLSANQEGALFKDINDEHEGMETAHLDSLTLRLKNAEELKGDPKHLPLWIANELTKPGRAFHNRVFMGGSMKGVRASEEINPVIKINTLKTAVQVQLRNAKQVAAEFQDDPEDLVSLIDNFWQAVRERFADAWNNKRDYILFQSIGLNGFAEFGGVLVDRAYEADQVERSDFEKMLAPLADAIDLGRDHWKGIAGAGGASQVAKELLRSSSPDAVKRERIRSKLRSPRTVESKLGIEA